METSRSRISVLCLALLAILLPTAALGSASKEQLHDELQALASDLLLLKRELADPISRSAYDAKYSRYRALSQQMGGDDPGHLGGAGRAKAAAASGRWPLKIVPAAPANCGTATTNFTQLTPLTIPTTVAVVTSTLVVSGTGPYLFDLDLTTNLRHSFSSDLDITLTSPAGTVVTLTTDNGGQFDNVFNGTLWDDDANPAGQVPYTTNNGVVTDTTFANLTTATPLVPEEAMGAFIGEDPNGTWTITVSDDAGGDGGSLDWSLDIDTFDCASADLSITKTDGVTTVTAGGSVTYTIVASNAGPSAVTGATVTDTFPAALTCTWACVGAAGGTCTAAGAGNIADTVGLPVGGSVTYTASCTISTTAAGTIVNTATVTPPAGMPDPAPGNNAATDVDTVSRSLAEIPTLSTLGLLLMAAALAVLAASRLRHRSAD